MRQFLRKSIFLVPFLLCGLDLSGQTDSLVIDSIMGRIKEILVIYNSHSVYVDTSDYVSGVEDAENINLQTAASMGACNEIISLVVRGADVNNFAGYTATPLHYAVSSGKWEAVEILLLLGADPDREDIFGNTPLVAAVRADSRDIAEKLIRFGATIDRADRQFCSPLHHSAALRNFLMTDMLLYYESPTELHDIEGNTPLMTAVWFGYDEITDLLLQSGADPNAPDRRGFTPLMTASQNGDTLIMNMLVKAGANLYALNDNGIDALGCAVIGAKKDAAAFLLEHGNRWNHTSGTSGDPVKMANISGQTDILQMMNDKGLKAKREYAFNQLSVSAAGWFTSHTSLTGGSLSITETGIGAGITVGAAVSPANQRMLVEGDNGIIYQYNVRSNLIYAGLSKEFLLTGHMNDLRISVTPALNLGYLFHSLYAGTEERPDDNFCLVPAAGLCLGWRNLSLNPGLAFMRTPFRKAGPAWFTMKVTYDLRRPQGNFNGKHIRLYSYE